MKIFFLVTASAIEKILKDASPQRSRQATFHEDIVFLNNLNVTSMFGFPTERLYPCSAENHHFIAYYNSPTLQKKWAAENSIPYDQHHWEDDIIKQQIDAYRPDVIYTNNPSLFNKAFFDRTGYKGLKAAWRAAPVEKGADFSHFDIGTSYAPVYLDLLMHHGVKNVYQHDFSFDPTLRKRVKTFARKDIDVSFVGRYVPMFQQRNALLHAIHKTFHKRYAIRFNLMTGRRVKGLLPHIPFRLLGSYRKPVFIHDLLETFNRAHIVFNCHSDIAGQYKGNMRVFETMGMGAFLLSDEGVYPSHMQAGRDFVTYRDQNDLLEKIDYYLQHPDERQTIAQQGYETIQQHYSPEKGFTRLVGIFERHLG